MPELFDISPPLGPDLAVFPGDTQLSREILSRLEDGDVVTLSTLRATVHLGAHVDAPSHYQAGGSGIDQTPLERLLGPCRVVRVGARGRLIEPETLAEALSPLSALGTPLPPRVLLATGSVADPTRWTTAFTALAPAAIEWLAAAGVTTIGIDTPSVDPADSKHLPAHAAVARHGMTILEGLRLDEVPAGDYELIALPLRLVGFDGSPVRAVLRSPDR
ncbi:MAG: arylformamidase [Gemmatimonadota bacterium]